MVRRKGRVGGCSQQASGNATQTELAPADSKVPGKCAFPARSKIDYRPTVCLDADDEAPQGEATNVFRVSLHASMNGASDLDS